VSIVDLLQSITVLSCNST